MAVFRTNTSPRFTRKAVGESAINERLEVDKDLVSLREVDGTMGNVSK
jgi:hypothetical protein